MIYIVETSDWRGDYSIGHLLDCKEPNAIKKYNEYKVRVAKDTYGIELDDELLFPIIKYHNISDQLKFPTISQYTCKIPHYVCNYHIPLSDPGAEI